METKSIDHEGEVIKVDGRKVTVAFIAQSGCSSCKAQGKCGMVEASRREIELEVASGEAYEVGEKVMLSVTMGMGNMAVVLAYVIPLVLLVVVMGVCSLCDFAEWSMALSGLGSVALYYGVLYIFRDKIETKINFRIDKQWKF